MQKLGELGVIRGLRVIRKPMRPIGPMRLMRLIGLIGLIGSCTSEVQGPAEEQRTLVQLRSYVATYEDYESLTPSPSPVGEGSSSFTRTDPDPAWLPSTDFEVDESHKAIGCYFTTAPSTPGDKLRIWFNDNNTVDTSDDKWYILGSEIKAGTFYMYGYMPNNAATASISLNDDPDNTYDKGAVLTLNDLGSIMTKDVCVLVGAKNGTTAHSDTGLKIGQFLCDMKSGGTGNQNYMYLFFEHIYARLDFRFRLDEDYAKLRTIKLKHVELTAYQCLLPNYSDAEKMKKTGSIAVHLKANDSNTSPIDNDIRFVPDGSADLMEPVILYDCEERGETDGQTLPSDKYTSGPQTGQYRYTTETGYVPYFNFDNPATKVLYTLRTTYDVYDNNPSPGHPEGNLIRKNCVAENAIKPRALFNTEQLDCGKRYEIKLTVNPTYLYVLSEPDLDNPSVVLE